ncbi:autotransporter domain-containing protein [Rhizobium sp. X9]|uniref:autotransporter outer membrane beta-barrel domain-containing protein n=1 Tax=Rhizobium sp. X9 TaxID=2815360 RepID=UPI00209A8154|nr:autotransporter domain-containing protein [Rhizobium sp. X9]
MSVTAFSQQAEFVGPGFNWSDPENWSTRTVPDSATDVVIDKLDAVIDFPGANAKTVVVKNGNHLGIVGPSSTLNTKVIDLSLNGQVGFSDGVTANNEAIFSKLQAGDVEVITSEVRKKILSGSLQPLHHSVIFNNGSNAGNGKISLNGRSVLFANRASADHAEIELSQGGAMTLESGSKAGSAVVRNSASLISLQTGSTLENASVNNVDDGLILFYKDSSGGAAEIYNSRSQILLADQSTLGTATVTNDADSLVLFGNQSHGASATVINKNGATIQAGPTKTSPMEIGSLSGAGDVYLGDQSLVTGGLGKNDTISGSIRDGFSEAYRRHQLESGVSTGTGPLSSNGLRKVGAGTLTLTGTNTFSGGTTVEAGTLKLGDGGTSGSILGDINNEAILVFDRSDDVTSANSISGTGEIIQAGSGSLLLTGDSSDFAGQTTVRNGALLVGKPGSDGALGGNLSVLEGARLGGSGIVGSGTGSLTSILSGGTLAAGNSIGTLTIDGDLKMASGSNFETEITSDGRSDLVNVTGKANLAGSNIRIVSVDADTSYQTERSYRILNADSGVNGLFSDTLSSSAFLNAELVYAPKSVDLKIALANDPGYLFPTVAETSNQLATARGLDTLAQSGSSLALYNDLLMLNADEARASFDRLSGEAYATAAGVLVDQSHFVRGAMNGRMQQAFGQSATTPAQESNPYFAWTTSYGSWGSYDGNSLFGDVSSSIGGFASGIDVDLFDTWRVGIMAGYGHSSFDVNERSSSGDSKNYTLGTYAASQWTLSESSALNFRSGLAHTWHDLSMNRNVAFPGFSDRLSSEYDASALQLFGEVGYELNMDRTIFEPYANAGFVRFNSDEFGEAGRTAASLSVTSATMNTWFTTIGLRAATELDIGETLVTARGDIGWRHSYGDVTPTSTASFVGSETFTVSGAPIARDVALIEAGFDIHFTKSAKLGVSYNGQFGSGTINNGVNAKFSVKF